MTHRVKNDAYYTPDRLAVAIVKNTIEHFEGVLSSCLARPRERLIVLEPHVGGGAFARAARQYDAECLIQGLDIDPLAAGFQDCDTWEAADFLEHALDAHLVIGNPPFARDTGRRSRTTGKPIMEAIWHRHVEQAIACAPLVVMLLRMGVLEGSSRKDWWRRHPPTRVDVLTTRPSFSPDNGTDNSAYGIFTWSAGHVGAPTLGWLDWRA